MARAGNCPGHFVFWRVLVRQRSRDFSDGGSPRRFVDLRGAFQRRVDVFTDIFGRNVTVEARFTQQLRRLRLRATDEHGAAAGVYFVREFLECGDTGGVDGGHVAEADDDDGRKRRYGVGDFGEFIGDAEEKRTVNAEGG